MKTPTQNIQCQQAQVSEFFNKKSKIIFYVVVKKVGLKENGNEKTPPSSHRSPIDGISNQTVEINGFKIKAFKR